MRIIAGNLRRRQLVAPKGLRARPTTDRVKEALFQHLVHQHLADGFHELNVVDLFAGSGALAFEAISRGATAAVLIDDDKHAINAQKSNASALGVTAQVRLIHGKLPKALGRVARGLHGNGGKAHVIFADPPYPLGPEGFAPIAKAVATAPWCAEEALLIYERERARAHEAPSEFRGWHVVSTRVHGETVIEIFEREAR